MSTATGIIMAAVFVTAIAVIVWLGMKENL